MPSHTILPEARRAALAAAVDEALKEVREASDVALLQECRALFRARVPLHLRAYVAAALALKAASGSSVRGGKGEDGRRRKSAEQRDRDREPQAKADRPAREPKKAEPRVREARPKEAKATERDDRERVAERENRYRGEGVTLFVSAGRRQRFYSRIAAKVVAEAAGIGEERIGDIRTMDNYSFVVVDPDVEEAVLSALSGYDWKGRSLTINRARKRGEGAPDASVPAGEPTGDLAGADLAGDAGRNVADGIDDRIDDGSDTETDGYGETDEETEPDAYGEPETDAEPDSSEADGERDPTAGA